MDNMSDFLPFVFDTDDYKKMRMIDILWNTKQYLKGGDKNDVQEKEKENDALRK